MSPIDPIVLGAEVVLRRDVHAAQPESLAAFSSYPAACAAMVIWRKANWQEIADLLLSDVDCLTLQVLDCRLKQARNGGPKKSVERASSLADLL